MALDTPDYKVLRKSGNVELRSYDDFISAQVKVEGRDHREAANAGFRILAAYIFGDNVSSHKIGMTKPVAVEGSSERIEMTAPVTVEGGEEYTVSFVMPRRYDIDTLPKPNDSRITFTKTHLGTVAAIRFSGFFSARNIEKGMSELKAWISKEKLETKGEYIVAGYDPPYKPWFLKRNEVLIRVVMEAD
jgi:hypothetical protein